MTACRADGSPLELVLDLGQQPLGNGFLAERNFSEEFKFHLRCGFSESSALFQLIEQPTASQMFNDGYKFESASSSEMQRHFAHLFRDLEVDPRLRMENGLILEIGSNDGVFLRNAVAAGITHVGFEPSSGVAAIARNNGVQVCEDFFSTSSVQSILASHGDASLIYAANAMCHISDIQDVLKAIDLILARDGMVVFEDPYLGDVLRKNSYDQIYDEHVFLFSATSVSRLFQTIDLELIDVESLPTHGGSARYWLSRRGRYERSTIVQDWLSMEEQSGMNHMETYIEFSKRVRASADELHKLLSDIADAGKKTVAIGATSKSTTVYNYARIHPDLISCIFDNTVSKQGLFSPGVHIPVLPDSEFVTSGADYAFLGAWNHANEIRSRYGEFTQSGGSWVTHVPFVGVLNA